MNTEMMWPKEVSCPNEEQAHSSEGGWMKKEKTTGAVAALACHAVNYRYIIGSRTN